MTPERLGQHFLADAAWRKRIALAIFGLAAHSSEQTSGGGTWIEIGAGHGEMTALLARHADHVLAIELDPRLMPALREASSTFPNVTIVPRDVLTLDFSELADSVRPAGPSDPSAGSRAPRFKVYGNLPYYITSPIVHRLFEHPDRLESAFILVQLEVAERIAAKPGTRDYGYFSVFAQFFAQPQILLRIPPGAFQPPPQVSSALVALRLPGEGSRLAIGDQDAFLRFLKACFAQKRKTLRNNLRPFVLPGTDIGRLLADCGLPSNVRAEELSLEQFAQIFKALAR